MLSRNKIKLIKSLEFKKSRTETGLFIAEGEKLVAEILDSQINVTYIAGTEDWFKKNHSNKVNRCTEKDIISPNELNRISLQKSPKQVLCIAEIPCYELNINYLGNDISIILDNVQDPGNLGTIIRIADWFGIEHIICSPGTADVFNPKVVQSTMGAICRVKIFYKNLNAVLSELVKNNIPVYGTFLNGENLYNTALTNQGAIIMGNESKGIAPDLLPFISKKLLIPNFPEGEKRSESLNVAIATAIICSEFRRR